jgi:hypothetical protein
MEFVSLYPQRTEGIIERKVHVTADLGSDLDDLHCDTSAHPRMLFRAYNLHTVFSANKEAVKNKAGQKPTATHV